MLKFSIAFYAAAILLAVLVNFGTDGQLTAVGAQQLTNAELGLSTLN